VIKLIIATRNEHKVGEIQNILGPDFECRTLSDFPGAPEVIEDAPTFAGNARKKASVLAGWLSNHASPESPNDPAFVLADDSGLEVDALQGAPGVHSARFAALDSGLRGNSSTADNNAKLLRLLRAVPSGERAARFRCVIALTAIGPGEPTVETFEGNCEGRIEPAPRGIGGFGYDPLFTPSGYEQTFGELGEDVKNQLSHRSKALAAVKRRFAISK
jgi:XTP/dITP diphosphohydrolase